MMLYNKKFLLERYESFSSNYLHVFIDETVLLRIKYNQNSKQLFYFMLFAGVNDTYYMYHNFCKELYE